MLTLDVGCGLVKRADITIDIDGRVNPTIIADICNLPLKNNIIDLTIAYNVLEHIVNYQHALRELRRVSKRVKVRMDATLSLVNWYHPEHEWVAINGRFYRRPWPLRVITRPLKKLLYTPSGKTVTRIMSKTYRWH